MAPGNLHKFHAPSAMKHFASNKQTVYTAKVLGIARLHISDGHLEKFHHRLVNWHKLMAVISFID